jgi:hypothetical protein
MSILYTSKTKEDVSQSGLMSYVTQSCLLPSAIEVTNDVNYTHQNLAYNFCRIWGFHGSLSLDCGLLLYIFVFYDVAK